VVYPGEERYPIGKEVEVVGLRELAAMLAGRHVIHVAIHGRPGQVTKFKKKQE